jgi:hypothetical protein
VLDLVQAPKISMEGQKYSKCTDNIRGILTEFEGKESFARLLACYHETIRAMSNINGQNFFIAANFVQIFDRSIVGEISLTSHRYSIIISRSS